jgi:hypothetical protein
MFYRSIDGTTTTVVRGFANAGSDECVPTDLVASVATAFPDRDGIAMAQRTDPFLGPILSALERTSSVRSSIGNDYAISGNLLYELLSGSTSNIPRLAVRSQFNSGLFVQALPRLLSWRPFYWSANIRLTACVVHLA